MAQQVGMDLPRAVRPSPLPAGELRRQDQQAAVTEAAVAVRRLRAPEHTGAAAECPALGFGRPRLDYETFLHAKLLEDAPVPHDGPTAVRHVPPNPVITDVASLIRSDNLLHVALTLRSDVGLDGDEGAGRETEQAVGSAPLHACLLS